jgi:hypothetical protein
MRENYLRKDAFTFLEPERVTSGRLRPAREEGRLGAHPRRVHFRDSTEVGAAMGKKIGTSRFAAGCHGSSADGRISAAELARPARSLHPNEGRPALPDE